MEEVLPFLDNKTLLCEKDIKLSSKKLVLPGSKFELS